MYPDRRKALELLYEAHSHNQGAWLGHSLTCAHCAERIAYFSGMDLNKAYVLGLLHDIGRKFGKRHLGHVSDGYSYMMSLSYDDVARICLTHSFNNKDINGYIGNFDTSEEETRLIREKLEDAILDDYDLLIQLCDAISGSEGVMDIIDRMSDVKRRYGNYDQDKWNRNLELKDYFENKMGMDIYEATDRKHYYPYDLYLKKDPVYVTGHINPDGDAICSAIALSELLNQIGINAKAITSCKISKECKYILSKCNVDPIEKKDCIDKEKIILVDHHDPLQSGFELSDDQIIGIIDHHEIKREISEDLYCFRNERIGATTSIVYEMYREKGVKIDEKIAGLLLSGLLSDTRNMNVNVHQEDIIAFNDLIGLSLIKDTDTFYKGLRDAYLDHSGMDDLEIFLSDYRDYQCEGIRYGISVIAVKDETEKKDMIIRMDQVMKKHIEELNVDTLFVKVKDEKACNMDMAGYGKDAKQILDSMDGKKYEKYYTFDSSYSRKMHLVPMIEKWVRENKHIGG